MARIIDLGGGEYIGRIEGDYVQGKTVFEEDNSEESETVDVDVETVPVNAQESNCKQNQQAKPKNYFEKINGKKIEKFM